MGQKRENRQETTSKYTIVKHMKKLKVKRNVIKVVFLKKKKYIESKNSFNWLLIRNNGCHRFQNNIVEVLGKKVILEFCVQQRCSFKNKEKQWHSLASDIHENSLPTDLCYKKCSRKSFRLKTGGDLKGGLWEGLTGTVGGAWWSPTPSSCWESPWTARRSTSWF